MPRHSRSRSASKSRSRKGKSKSRSRKSRSRKSKSKSRSRRSRRKSGSRSGSGSRKKRSRKSRSPGGKVSFYCVGCRKKTSVSGSSICFNKDKRGRPRLIGKCPCGQKCYKYVKMSSADAMKSKYGRC